MSLRSVKWGNSLGLRISKAPAEGFSLHNGSELDVQVQQHAKRDKQLVIQSRKPHLDRLLDGMEVQARPKFTEFNTVGREAL